MDDELLRLIDNLVILLVAHTVIKLYTWTASYLTT